MTISSHLRSLTDRKTHISSVPSPDLQSGLLQHIELCAVSSCAKAVRRSRALPAHRRAADPQLPTRTDRLNRNGAGRPGKRAACGKVGVTPRNYRRAGEDLAREDYHDPPAGFAGTPPAARSPCG